MFREFNSLFIVGIYIVTNYSSSCSKISVKSSLLLALVTSSVKPLIWRKKCWIFRKNSALHSHSSCFRWCSISRIFRRFDEIFSLNWWKRRNIFRQFHGKCSYVHRLISRIFSFHEKSERSLKTSKFPHCVLLHIFLKYIQPFFSDFRGSTSNKQFGGKLEVITRSCASTWRRTATRKIGKKMSATPKFGLSSSRHIRGRWRHCWLLFRRRPFSHPSCLPIPWGHGLLGRK